MSHQSYLNRLVGDPCINRWEGVDCALESALDASLAEGTHDLVSGQDCAPGPSTIAPGRCHVVGLRLQDNNMRGSLLGTKLGSLTSLTSLVLSDNEITGRLPDELLDMPSLTVLDLGNNQIEYVESQRLAIRCERGKDREGLDCAGLPPQSCLAFGKQHVVRLDDSRQCAECAGRWIAFIANGVLLGLFMLALLAYFRVITKHPDALTKWVSTASIFVAHLQTLTIISRLQLAWPDSSQLAIGLLSFDALQFDALRPECMASADVPFYYYITIGKIGAPLLTLALLFVGRLILQAIDKGTRRSSAGAPAVTDRLEFFETVIFHVQLVTSWSNAADLILRMGTGLERRDQLMANVGASVAIALLGLECVLIAKYARNTVELVRLSKRPPSLEARRESSSRLSIGNLTHEQLQYRMRYTTKRFASHAPYWQFVVWTRQAALTIVSLLPDLLLSPQQQDDLTLSQGSAPALIWIHAALAIAIFAAGYVVHHRIRPYVFDFQNWIEKFLFIASGVAVLLASLYTVFDAKVLAIEILLLCTLIGSVVGAALYLGYDFRRKRVKLLERVVDFGSKLVRATTFSTPSPRSTATTPRSGPMIAIGDIGLTENEGPQGSRQHWAIVQASATPCGLSKLTSAVVTAHAPPAPPAGEFDELSLPLSASSLIIDEASLKEHLPPPPPPDEEQEATRVRRRSLKQLGQAVMASNRLSARAIEAYERRYDERLARARQHRAAAAAGSQRARRGLEAMYSQRAAAGISQSTATSLSASECSEELSAQTGRTMGAVLSPCRPPSAPLQPEVSQRGAMATEGVGDSDAVHAGGTESWCSVLRHLSRNSSSGQGWQSLSQMDTDEEPAGHTSRLEKALSSDESFRDDAAVSGRSSLEI